MTKNVPSSRRVFLMQSMTAGFATAMTKQVYAQVMVVETDPQAAALGYKSDATTIDKTKQTKYAAGQACGNCALFQGAAAAAAGGCPLFAGKQVSSKGWCTAYAKKA